jgi:hypothetical protein
MAWSKLDDHFFLNPKIMQAGIHATALYLSGLCHCSRLLTDGDIAAAMVPKLAALADVSDATGAAARLVELGLWEVTPAGYAVHDYLDYNLTAEQIRARRAATARRVGQWRADHADDTDDGNEVRNAGCNAVTDGVTNDVSNETPHTPYPVSRNPGSGDPAPVPRACAREPATEGALALETAPAVLSLRAFPKPNEIERAKLESHPLYAPLVTQFGKRACDLDGWRDIIAALDEMGARPEDVPRAAVQYDRIMGTDKTGRQIVCSPQALVKYWPACVKPQALAPPPRAPGDHRMPINGELKRDDFTGAGQYAHIFNRPYDDDTPLEELEREMLMQGDDVTRHAATP